MAKVKPEDRTKKQIKWFKYLSRKKNKTKKRHESGSKNAKPMEICVALTQGVRSVSCRNRKQRRQQPEQPVDTCEDAQDDIDNVSIYASDEDL